MLMTESELFRRRSIAKRIMRGLVFPALLRLYDALLYIGTNNRSFYERYGAGRVAAGRYGQVLRYREHFEPLAEAVRRRVLVEEPCAASAS